MLSPKLELWVDVDDFEHMWTAGQQLEKQGDIERAAKQYQLAEELYIAQLEGKLQTSQQAKQWAQNWLQKHKIVER